MPVICKIYSPRIFALCSITFVWWEFYYTAHDGVIFCLFKKIIETELACLDMRELGPFCYHLPLGLFYTQREWGWGRNLINYDQ